MAYAMNNETATKTTPVIQNVIISASSMVPQLDASGVNHQGLKKVNTTVITTNSTNIIAKTIVYSQKED